MKNLSFLSTLLLISIGISFTSCEKEIDQLEGNSSGGSASSGSSKKEYTIKSNLDLEDLVDQYEEYGTDMSIRVDFTIYEYNDNNKRIKTREWSKVKEGRSKSYTSASGAEKVIIRMEMEIKADNEKVNINKYIDRIFYLDDNKTTITISNSTPISNYNPI